MNTIAERPPDPAILEIVHHIAAALNVSITASRLDGRLQAQLRPFVRTAFTKWEYDERGIGEHKCDRSLIEKPIWWGMPLEAVIADVHGVIEWASRELSAIDSSWDRTTEAVVKVCEELGLAALEGTGWTEPELTRLAILLETTFRRQPVRAWVRADLVGVAVLTEPLEFGDSECCIRLRAIVRGDLEEDTFAEWDEAAKARLHTRPSAVLEVEYRAVDGSGWQPHLERAVTVLGLFGCGGVSWTRVEAGTDSLLEIHNVFAVIDRGSGVRTYAIRQHDVRRLPQFWNSLTGALPLHFYWKEPDNPDGIHAALLNYQAVAAGTGFVNEKIAELMRSLESLLLNEGEKRGVSAMLRQRSVALLDACGLPSSEVDTLIKLAYEVRSRYVHGARLAPDTERTIEETVGILDLFNRVLEYNRVALVAAVVSGLEKVAFIRALDDPGALSRIGRAFVEAEGSTLGRKAEESI